MRDLTGIYDNYKITSQIQQILQIVNILPHEKLKKFDLLTDHLDEMLKSIDLPDCISCSPHQENSDSESSCSSLASSQRLNSQVSARSSPTRSQSIPLPSQTDSLPPRFPQGRANFPLPRSPQGRANFPLPRSPQGRANSPLPRSPQGLANSPLPRSPQGHGSSNDLSPRANRD